MAVAVAKQNRIFAQRRIFDALQGRLLEIVDDELVDADQLSDLSTAVRCAAETLEVLEGED